MWKLKRVGNSILEQYAKEMLPSLIKRIIKGRTINNQRVCLEPSQISILIPNYGEKNKDTSILKGLLILEPKELYSHCTNLMLALTDGKYNPEEFTEVLQLKNKEKLNPAEKSLVLRYKIFDTLKILFDYDGQISSNKVRSYWLAQVKDTLVCTYCNRQYTFTVAKYQNGNDEYIARPELDHWFSKEMYPLLSLSFYNLIPSCHICNSSAKGNKLFNFHDYVHPYLQQNDNPDIKFRPTFRPQLTRSYGVTIIRNKSSREDHTIEAFALDEIYDLHGPLEVDDLMNFNSAYTNSYLH